MFLLTGTLLLLLRVFSLFLLVIIILLLPSLWTSGVAVVVCVHVCVRVPNTQATSHTIQYNTIPVPPATLFFLASIHPSHHGHPTESRSPIDLTTHEPFIYTDNLKYTSAQGHLFHLTLYLPPISAEFIPPTHSPLRRPDINVEPISDSIPWSLCPPTPPLQRCSPTSTLLLQSNQHLDGRRARFTPSSVLGSRARTSWFETAAGPNSCTIHPAMASL